MILFVLAEYIMLNFQKDRTCRTLHFFYFFWGQGVGVVFLRHGGALFLVNNVYFWLIRGR